MSRIAILLPNFDIGGSEVVGIELGNSLASLGEEVTFVVGERRGDLLERLLPDTSTLELGRTRARTAVARLRHLLRFGNFEVVATFHSQMMILAALATWRTDVRLIASEHSLVVDRLDRFVMPRRQVQSTFLRWSFLRSAAVTSPSQMAAAQVSELTRGRVNPSVLPNPVLANEDGLSSGPPHMWLAEQRVGPCLAIVGRVAPEKHVDLAVAITGELRSRGLDARLLIVGPVGRSTQGALFKVDPDWVDLVGPVSDARSWIYYADLVLVTSEFESFGNVIVEAVAARTPVLAVATRGMPQELIARLGGGHFIPGRSVSLSADAAQGLLDGNVPPVQSIELEPYRVDVATLEYLAILGRCVER